MKARRVKKLEPRESLAENAARIVVVRLDEMRSLAPKALKPEGVKQQHDMRIAAKRLRYVLEATEFCFGRTGEVARRRARDLQGILGELHDCDVMLPRVQRHLADLRDADADAVRGRAGEADDLDPALAARAPHRTSYRGLEILMVYLQARRRLLFDRFREYWAEQERAGSWDRLERSAQRRLEEARERRRAAKRAERARRELEEAEREERQAALRAATAAEELRRARRTAGPETTPLSQRQPTTQPQRQPAPPQQRQQAAPPPRPAAPRARRQVSRHAKQSGPTGARSLGGTAVEGLRRLLIVLAGGVVAAVLVTGTAAGHAKFVKGSAGLGDPYFPKAGNGGYDARHYGIEFRYKPKSNFIRARTKILATATENLSRFDLDFRHLGITSLRVNGKKASFKRSGQELKITPRHGLRKGKPFTVQVRYRGHPRPVTDPDGAADGWIPTDDGAFVASEPQGAPSWFPCNDYPTDKATYAISGHGAEGQDRGLQRGACRAAPPTAGSTTFKWRERSPMATYLATATSGKFDVTRSKANGIPSYDAVDPREAQASVEPLAQIPAILRLFGPASAPTRSGPPAPPSTTPPGVGYALETQTRPLYDGARRDHASRTRSPTSGSATRSR